jgi:predicted Zn-dependent protease
VKRGLAALAAIGALAACTDPTVPSRGATYAFADGFGDVFHWPTDRLPVRVFAQQLGDLRPLVQRAIDLWQQQLLYGEFRAELVDDSAAADVVIRWSDSVPPAVDPDPGPPAKACGGITHATVDSTGQALADPFDTEITILTGTVFTPEQVEACVRRTVVHEFGHVLGLFQEAPDTLAIMYTPPQVSEPAPIDRRTIQVLYHTTPTLGPPPRR